MQPGAAHCHKIQRQCGVPAVRGSAVWAGLYCFNTQKQLMPLKLRTRKHLNSHLCLCVLTTPCNVIYVPLSSQLFANSFTSSNKRIECLTGYVWFVVWGRLIHSKSSRHIAMQVWGWLVCNGKRKTMNDSYSFWTLLWFVVQDKTKCSRSKETFSKEMNFY